MRIVAADLLHLRLRLRRPFETSHGRITEKDTVLVRAYADDGSKGYGEAPAFQGPWYDDEYTHAVLAVLRRFILPSVLGRDLDGVGSLEACYGWIAGHHMAKAAVEAACWDLQAQADRVPLHTLWGGTARRIDVGISLGIESDVGALVDLIEESISRGYRRVKIKIRPGWDNDVVEAIRSRFPSLVLMADANSAYRAEDLTLLASLDEYGLLMLEQPFASDDLVQHAALQRRMDTPVCLDESIRSIGDVSTAIELDAARIINVKPARLGGYARARAVAVECAGRGIPVWCGGMLETGIGKAANIHLSSLSAFSLPGDTSGTDRYFEHDVLREPIVVDQNGCIDVPTGPGLGYEIDEPALQKLTIAAKTLRAADS